MEDPRADDEDKAMRPKASSRSSAASTESTSALYSDMGLEDAIASMDETRNVVDTMSKVQTNFYEAQQRMNAIDVTQLEVHVTIRTLVACYNTVRSHMIEHDAGFDTDSMQTRLDQMLKKVVTSNDEFSKYKGEFIAVNEPFVTKDLL